MVIRINCLDCEKPLHGIFQGNELMITPCTACADKCFERGVEEGREQMEKEEKDASQS
jgi:hypothetical protein